MNASSSTHSGVADLAPRAEILPFSPVGSAVRRWVLAGLAAAAVACGVLAVSSAPKAPAAHPQAVVSSIQYARVSGHFRDTDVKTIFGALATQVQAGLAVDPSLARKIDTFDVDSERLVDVMNDLCTISVCDWSVEAGSPPTLSIRPRAKASE